MIRSSPAIAITPVGGDNTDGPDRDPPRGRRDPGRPCRRPAPRPRDVRRSAENRQHDSEGDKPGHETTSVSELRWSPFSVRAQDIPLVAESRHRIESDSGTRLYWY